MKDRTVPCIYYTYKDGPCDKRGISVCMKDCQTCKKYEPRKNGQPRPDNRSKERIKFMNDKRNWE